MAEENKGVALAILGIVAVIAVVGLIMLFTGSTGQGVYGGQMRQGESDIRPYYEEPGRYTSPVPADEGGTYYSGRGGTDRNWWAWSRNPCQDKVYPVVTSIAKIGGRTDCIPSDTRDMFCCAQGGQAGALDMGGYE